MAKLYSLILFFAAFISVSAQKTYLRENFNYAAGSLLTANGWYSHSTPTTNPNFMAVTNEGLSWSKTTYIGSGKGRAAAVVNNGSDENRPFDSWADTMSVYASFLVKADSAIGTTNSGYFFHFVQYMNPANPVFTSTSTSFRARVYSAPGSSVTTFKIGLTFNSTAVTDGGVSEDLNVGETYLVVAKYTFISGADNDQVSIYVFKDGDNITSEPSKPTVGPLTRTGTAPDLSSIQGVALRQFANGQKIIVDGIYARNHWNMTTEGTSSAKDIHAAALSLYPNPSAERIINISSTDTNPIKATVYDVSGRVMFDGNVQNQIDLSHCFNGLYFVKMTQNNETISKKLVLH